MENLCCAFSFSASNGGWFINESRRGPRRVVESFTPESKVPRHAVHIFNEKKKKKKKKYRKMLMMML